MERWVCRDASHEELRKDISPREKNICRKRYDDRALCDRILLTRRGRYVVHDSARSRRKDDTRIRSWIYVWSRLWGSRRAHLGSILDGSCRNAKSIILPLISYHGAELYSDSHLISGFISWWRILVWSTLRKTLDENPLGKTTNRARTERNDARYVENVPHGIHRKCPDDIFSRMSYRGAPRIFRHDDRIPGMARIRGPDDDKYYHLGRRQEKVLVPEDSCKCQLSACDLYSCWIYPFPLEISLFFYFHTMFYPFFMLPFILYAVILFGIIYFAVYLAVKAAMTEVNKK